MFIVWGTKIKRKQLGRVAELCPICRDPRPFRVARVGAASHLYWISFGQGKLVGHEATCEECGTTMETAVEDYSTVSRGPDAGLENLIHETHPALKEAAAEWREIDERARSKRLSAEERRELLVAPFYVLNPMVERQKVEQRMGPAGQWIAVATLAMFAAVLALIAIPDPSEPMKVVVGALIMILGMGLVATLYLKLTHMRSFMNREIHPKLVRALTPLAPSLEELNEIKSHLRDFRMALGWKLRPAKLSRALASRGVHTRPGVSPTPIV